MRRGTRSTSRAWGQHEGGGIEGVQRISAQGEAHPSGVDPVRLDAGPDLAVEVRTMCAGHGGILDKRHLGIGCADPNVAQRACHRRIID
jgi:hypothetical protein